MTTPVELLTDWKYEVANDDTRLGLIEWLEAMLEHDLYEYSDIQAAIAEQPAKTPVRVIVDISSGLFENAYSETPVEILAIDTDDAENPRATVPSLIDNAPIWACLQNALVRPEFVGKAFSEIRWLPGEDDSSE